MLYQTLVGAWPIGIERVCQFARKALREAKAALELGRAGRGATRRDVAAFRRGDPRLAARSRTTSPRSRGGVAAIGERNSLGLLVLKLAAPGVPDIYWGNENWDLSLVDPDNRRPVDFAARRRREPEVRGHEGRPDVAPRASPSSSQTAIYVPIEVAGRNADHVVAFARVHEEPLGGRRGAAPDRGSGRLGRHAARAPG